MHIHNSKLIPVQNDFVTFEEAIAAIEAASGPSVRLRDAATGQLKANEVTFDQKAVFGTGNQGAKLLLQPGTSCTYYDAKNKETKNGYRWKCSQCKYGCKACAYVKEIGGKLMVGYANIEHTGHK